MDMANAEDDKILYEHLDLITDALNKSPLGGDGYGEDVVRELLMRVMGLVWQPQVNDGAPGFYALNPDDRDRATNVMRRWLTDQGFLPRPRRNWRKIRRLR
jgi:hypothetical protein